MADSLSPLQRQTVYARSHGRCEALVTLPQSTGAEPTWVRCFDWATDIHHMLTKARGGDVLDQMHETYHLIHLCRRCHRLSDGADAYAGGILIEGQVSWDPLARRPVYTGPDPYLTLTYPGVRS